MRSRSFYLLAVCHPIGVNRVGPHKHNDWLSFELCVGDRPVIIDPGTCCYTGDMAMRRLFRSTAYHNTVVVDGEEQVRIDNSMFGLVRPHGDVNVLRWRSEPAYDLLEAEHTGYTRLPRPVVHRRRFLLDRAAGQLEITDTFHGTGSHLLQWHFHLDIGLHCTVSGHKAVISQGHVPILGIHFPDKIDHLEKATGWVSRSYNTRREAEIVCWSHRVSLADSPGYTTLLVPAADPGLSTY